MGPPPESPQSPQDFQRSRTPSNSNQCICAGQMVTSSVYKRHSLVGEQFEIYFDELMAETSRLVYATFLVVRAAREAGLVVPPPLACPVETVRTALSYQPDEDLPSTLESALAKISESFDVRASDLPAEPCRPRRCFSWAVTEVRSGASWCGTRVSLRTWPAPRWPTTRSG